MATTTTFNPNITNSYLPRTPQNYFSWRYGPCAFIALDPNERFPIDVPASSWQYRWFRDQLESGICGETATWHFVFHLSTALLAGLGRIRGDETIRQLLEPFIESSAIDFVVAGHTHDYERLTKMYGRPANHVFDCGRRGRFAGAGRVFRHAADGYGAEGAPYGKVLYRGKGRCVLRPSIFRKKWWIVFSEPSRGCRAPCRKTILPSCIYRIHNRSCNGRCYPVCRRGSQHQECWPWFAPVAFGSGVFRS